MKLTMYIGAGIGGIVGGYLPTLWGAGLLDAGSLLCGSAGTLLGLWLGYMAGKYLDL